MKRNSFLLVLAVLGCFGLLSLSARASGGGSDGGETPREYQIKVGFLYNFIKYVDWPGSKSTVTIGVLGKNPFGTALGDLSGKVANGKTLAVRNVSNLSDARNVDVLFISASEADHLKQVLDSLKGQTVLTVGEVNGFCQNDGIINFTNEGNKIRFQINPNAAERANLKISSYLLRLAKVVRE